MTALRAHSYKGTDMNTSNTLVVAIAAASVLTSAHTYADSSDEASSLREAIQ